MNSNDIRLKKTLTMIHAWGNGAELLPLTNNRSKSSFSFGGKYRVIDITLSNCINSDLHRIYVLTQYKSDSLHEHIYNAWKIFHPELGEFINSVPPQQKLDKFWYMGTADAVFQNIDLIKDNDENLLLLSSDRIYKMDYSKLLHFHNELKADLTIAYIKLPKEISKHLSTLEINSNNKIIVFNNYPLMMQMLRSNTNTSLVNMGICLFNTKALKEVFKNMANENLDIYDFEKDVIPYMIRNNFNVAAYPFMDDYEKGKAYWKDVGTIDSYYKANMDLLEEFPSFDLYDENWQLRTKHSNYPPVKAIAFGNRQVNRIHNSLIADGSVISGGTVTRSVLGFKVNINNDAYVADSIIMDFCKIGHNSRIRNAIIDKNVIIPENVSIGFNLEDDRKNYFVTKSGIVVVPQNYVFNKIKNEHEKIIMNLVERIEKDRSRNVANRNLVYR